MRKPKTPRQLNQRRGQIYESQLRQRATPAELAFQRILDEVGYWYRFQARFFDASRLYIADFRLATAWKKVIIEIDGSSHRHKAGYDAARTAWLEGTRNCQVIRFTNAQVLKTPDEVKLALAAVAPPLKFWDHIPNLKAKRKTGRFTLRDRTAAKHLGITLEQK